MDNADRAPFICLNVHVAIVNQMNVRLAVKLYSQVTRRMLWLMGHGYAITLLGLLRTVHGRIGWRGSFFLTVCLIR